MKKLTPTGFSLRSSESVVTHDADAKCVDISGFGSLFDQSTPEYAGAHENRTDATVDSGRIAGRRRPLAEPRPCKRCGRWFQTEQRYINRGNGLYCSLTCSGAAVAEKLHRRQSTPDSTHAERIRANGLINSRIRDGKITRPDACQYCGKVKKVDAHHPDYRDGELVAFLCRSCHMKAHNNRDFEIKVARLARKMTLPDTKAPPHGRGGRRGPTGKAKGRPKLVRIRSVVTANGLVAERLACGHTHTRDDDGKRPVQRRCATCGPVSSTPPRPSPTLEVAPC